MATIIHIDGIETDVSPCDGQVFTLKELQWVVKGCIEIINLGDDQAMVVNENGKVDNLDLNAKATVIALPYLFRGDSIRGDVLVCRRIQNPGGEKLG